MWFEKQNQVTENVQNYFFFFDTRVWIEMNILLTLVKISILEIKSNAERQNSHKPLLSAQNVCVFHYLKN